ncbi:YkgJ family cysteine cluster protein [Lysobacter capsici]|uniref:YkgJ family cysteine cluster protein n=1 Tax=Lysobacter capsici TaxID=435897 RepID=UPI003CCD6B3C
MPEQRSEWTFKGSPLNRTIADEVLKPKPLRGSHLEDILTRNNQKIDELRRRIPSFTCIVGCSDCCGPVTASSEEMARLPVRTQAEHDVALAELSCPHLGSHGCEVYNERPLICRLFGTTPRLLCPN